jgi:putative Mn2+ efflux pump MntP
MLEIIILSISLAMDAVSVSIAGGVEVQHAKLKHALRVALFFGGFQALMPLLGWFVGNTAKVFVAVYAPWIAFILLTGIGLVMIKEARSEISEDKKSILSHKTLLLLAVATSIDAFVVGISLGLTKIPLLLSVSTIGLITFGLCIPAFLFGSHLNKRFEGKLDMLGGVALILIGLKTLLSAIF